MTIEGLGKKFQEARLARKLTLDEAARMTKIRPTRLAEIEADDFSQFPSLAYAKGFILIYGKFLDVDVTPYMEAFEGSEAVTVDGYSYLQDNPAPKPVRTRVASRRSRPVSSSSSSGPTSLMPLVIGIVVMVVGFMAVRFVMNLQRIGHKTEPTPTPTAAMAQATIAPTATPISVLAPPPAPSPTAAATAVAQATKAPVVATPSPAATKPATTPVTSPAAVALATTKPATPAPPPSATPAGSKAAVASPVASKAPVATPAASKAPAAPVAAAPSPSAAPSIAVVSASPAAATGPEPEVRKAEPVRAEDLTKAAAGTTAATAQTTGANKMTIRPLKKTYLRVMVDNGAGTPTFEKWVSPGEAPLEFKGQHFSVRVLDRNAVQIKKNGKTVAEDDADVKIE